MSIPPVERTPIQWTNTQGANLYSTGASGPAAVRPVHAVNAVESADKLGEGVTVTIKSPEKPSDKSLEDRDWTEVQEKKVISQFATVGIYYYSQGQDFVNAAIDMIVDNDRVNGEFYTCPTYNYAIKEGKRIGIYDIPFKAMHGIGTPDDLNKYLEARF